MALPILRGAETPVRRAENYRGTALTAFNPWRELEEMDRWFQEFMGRSFFGGAGALPGGAAASPAPGVDVYESPDELRMFVYAPGASPDGFDVSVAGNTLTIRGERRPLIEGEGWTAHGSGVARARGSFQTSYTLPAEVDADAVSATYRGGILELRLPKSQRARVRSVKVNVENPRIIEAAEATGEAATPGAGAGADRQQSAG